MDPLGHWRKNDPPDRQGITENLHVQGYLAYWDELRRRHPNLIIDSCASGGRRNDLETLRRAVPLHPTDYNYSHLAAKQAFHLSLFQWIPYFGSNTMPIDTVDAYAFRSGHGMAVVIHDVGGDDQRVGRSAVENTELEADLGSVQDQAAGIAHGLCAVAHEDVRRGDARGELSHLSRYSCRKPLRHPSLFLLLECLDKDRAS